ncbi:MAG: GlxA family transcriptional regulator, partial [Cupriavidus sp.]|nr:GlxA family transcriptional regulator [Cupriavidus sp.]
MHHVAIALYPGFQALNLAVSTVLEFANRALGEPLYRVHLLSEHGGPVASSAGFAVSTAPFGRRRFDTVLGVGDNDVLPAPPALVKFLRRAARTSRRIG